MSGDLRPGGRVTGRSILEAIERARVRVTGGAGTLVARGSSATVVSEAGDTPGRRVTFFARITGSTSISANRWSYQWEEVVLDASGAWVARTSGRTHTTRAVALNLVEAANSATGTQGNGIDVANLPAGFALQPAPNGIIVEMHQVRRVDGSAHAWWFAHENGIDGVCPEPEA